MTNADRNVRFMKLGSLALLGVAHRDAPVNPNAPTVVQNAQFLTSATANAFGHCALRLC